MIALAMATVLAVLPDRVEPVEYDAIVRNVVHCQSGGIALDQVGGVTLRSIYGEPADYHWEWWRLTGDAGLPVRDAGGWRLAWYDSKHKRHRVVSSRCYFEWHSGWDLEIADREVWPVKQRRGLR